MGVFDMKADFSTQRRRDAEVFMKEKGFLSFFFSASLRLCVSILFLAVAIFAQSPKVEKVEPSNWWANHSINPVRLLIRGENLTGARVVSNSRDLRVGNFRTSANGHYLFVDMTIDRSTRVGKHDLRIATQNGNTDFQFEVSQKMPRENRFRGFTPDDVIYFLIPDRFADGDQSNNNPAKSPGLLDRSKGRHYHGGDLQGVINHLDYIKSLGVTAIWTTPVYDNNDRFDTKEVYPNVPETTGYHGYGAIDFYAVEERLGDMAKLREFVRVAQSKGFKVIQDQIANHTGPYHVWANDAPTPTWWNGTVENHLSNNWQKWTTMNPRATFQTQQKNLDGWFIDILPDFNQNDPEVEKYLIQNTLWWVEMAGFDSIRMDTLPHVPRSFWAKWMAAIKREYPNLNVMGELYDGDPALLSYFQKGKRGHDGIDTGIDTLYDFALFYAIRNAFGQGKNIREVSQIFSKDWLYPNPDVLVTFLGVHDMPRFMNEPGAGIEGLKLAQTLIMTSRGTPLLYYGDELAMTGGNDPDNRRDFPGGFAGDPRSAFLASGRTIQENEVWNHLAKLGALRRELEPLRRGKTLDLYDAEQQTAYARVTEKEAVIVVFNNDSKNAGVQFDLTDLKPIPANAILIDRLGKVADVGIENRIMKINMPARTASIFTVKR
jgi:glycosidase